MSSKDLQRVTECVSYIGQTSSRHSLPARRNHITQKVKIVDQRTLYLSVHNDAQPAEVFLHVKGSDCSAELIGLYAVVARPMSLTLQYDAPPEKVGDLFAGAKCIPCGPVVGHDRITHCTNLREIIDRHLLGSGDRRYSILPPREVPPAHQPTIHHTKGPHQWDS